MVDIHPSLRAELDRELASAVDSLLGEAAKHDGKDLIEANVDLMNDLFVGGLSRAQLAAGVAGLAIRLRRSGGSRG